MEKFRFFLSFSKAAFLLFATLFFLLPAAPQTTAISGVVNTYHQVLEIVPSKACLRITNVAVLDVNSKVMVIQMKGASVNTANNSSFGDTTSLNEAGNYEIGTVCRIIGDSVFLFHNLLNNYLPATGKVQLIQFAEYYAVNIVDTVKALSWNNSTGTGGVIAISVDEDLELNAPVYADAAGYRGGEYRLSGNTCSNTFPASGYTYNGNTTSPQQSGSFKGEGVFDITASISGGRGAPANGGGGGNNHNNGGAGGANLTPGGDGGGNSSITGCVNDYHGRAGKALSSWNGKKIFLGGGGGAGHSNASFTVSNGGGHGGGIVLIIARNIIGNGYSISASGQQGGPGVSDGASGGGAGGTIIMNVMNSYSGTVSIQARGGNGGNENDGGNSGRCYGAGGGGSGGMIYFNGSLPGITTSVSGGIAGAEIGPDPACNTLVLPAAGTPGSIAAGYAYARSTSPAGYCTLLLPVKLISFAARVVNRQVLLNWEIQNPEQAYQYIPERSTNHTQWSALAQVPADDQENRYNTRDENPPYGTIFYRLRIIEKNNAVSYSPVRTVVIAAGQPFSVYPNPARDLLHIQSDKIPYELKLMDSRGMLIYRERVLTNNRTITISSLQKGIYFIQLNETVQKLFIH